ncbi:hypothetical protein Droror1_Dr00018696 [Drosera rotundifolia]
MFQSSTGFSYTAGLSSEPSGLLRRDGQAYCDVARGLKNVRHARERLYRVRCIPVDPQEHGSLSSRRAVPIPEECSLRCTVSAPIIFKLEPEAIRVAGAPLLAIIIV